MREQRGYIILGGSGATGGKIAEMLVQRGDRVMLAGRSIDRLKAVSAKAGDAPYQKMDARSSQEVDAAVQAAHSQFGRLDGLVNCVGTFALKPLHLMQDADFEQDIEVNLKSAFYATRAAVRLMDAKIGGSVVLFSSVAARFGMPNHESIAAAKAGVLGLMLSAAATYAPDNFRINAIAPGLIQTPLTQSITTMPAMAQASANMHPLRRLGEPEDVARMAAFLLDPANDFITGQVFGVDGGLATLRPKR
jgi:3-oxoacyl-[acyl-carrier protein] reductase